MTEDLRLSSPSLAIEVDLPAEVGTWAPADLPDERRPGHAIGPTAGLVPLADGRIFQVIDGREHVARIGGWEVVAKACQDAPFAVGDEFRLPFILCSRLVPSAVLGEYSAECPFVLVRRLA